jgi:hypothetical protein
LLCGPGWPQTCDSSVLASQKKVFSWKLSYIEKAVGSQPRILEMVEDNKINA